MNGAQAASACGACSSASPPARTLPPPRHHEEELRALGADRVDGDYDVILELVGGDNFREPGAACARGTHRLIGMGAGAMAEVDFGC